MTFPYKSNGCVVLVIIIDTERNSVICMDLFLALRVACCVCLAFSFYDFCKFVFIIVVLMFVWLLLLYLLCKLKMFACRYTFAFAGILYALNYEDYHQ